MLIQKKTVKFFIKHLRLLNNYIPEIETRDEHGAIQICSPMTDSNGAQEEDEINVDKDCNEESSNLEGDRNIQNPENVCFLKKQSY